MSALTTSKGFPNSPAGALCSAYPELEKQLFPHGYQRRVEREAGFIVAAHLPVDVEAEVGLCASGVQGRGLIEPVDAKDFADRELGRIYVMGLECERKDIFDLGLMIEALRIRDGDVDAGLVAALAAHDFGGVVLPLVRRVRRAARVRRARVLLDLARASLDMTEIDFGLALSSIEGAAFELIAEAA